MNGDFYRVVQVAGAPECPYLEYVDPANCPDVSYDTMLRCEDPCLCEVRVQCPYRNGVASTAESLERRHRRGPVVGSTASRWTHCRDAIDAPSSCRRVRTL